MPRFETFDGLSLHYSDAGRGKPVLCLAGLTRSLRDFDYMAAHLTGIRLIRMDYRGRGQSDWAADYHSYAVPTEARDVLALLDHLGLDRVPVIGTSRGGIIGMFLAATARDRLAGLCLNDIGPVIESGGLEVIKAYLGRNPPHADHAAMAAAMPTSHPGFDGVPPERWLQEAQRRSNETPQGLVVNYDPRLRDAVIEAAAAPAADLWPLFDALVGLPVAVIRGANSDLLSAQTLAEMRRRRPDMIHGEVPDRGHIPFLDEPAALAVINAWLELVA